MPDEVKLEPETRTPRGLCVWCKAPIFDGDIIRYYGPTASGVEEWGHRFTTWCDEYRRSVKRGDDYMSKQMGIILD